MDILSFINLLHIYIYTNFAQDTESPPQTLSRTILSILAISTVAIFSLTHIKEAFYETQLCNIFSNFTMGFKM
jgi:hypothetical protein